MHEPHPDPTLNVTCLHLVVDSTISLMAHQQPHNGPSRGHFGPPLHNAPCVVGTSANFCRSKAPHFLGGPVHLSQALLPSLNSKSSAPVHEKPNLTCSFSAALKYATADRYPEAFNKAPDNWSLSTVSGKGWTSCSEALCLHHHKRDRSDSTADLAYLSASFRFCLPHVI